MKRILVSIFAAACLLGLCACGKAEPDASLSYGRYTAQSGALAWVDLSSDQRFEFAYSSVMSAYPSGTFEVKDGKLYATSDLVLSGVYVFEIVDQETIRFCKDESAEIQVEDGTVYKLEHQE